MEVNSFAELKDGDSTRSLVLIEAPSIVAITKPKSDGNIKKKRRRGKTKRKIIKPYLKISWQERRKNEVRNNTKRNNRFRKIVLAKTQAPFNNNQFLMEIHKPEPENNIFRTPSARTRDSSFSIDSEDNNYFFPLPEDEEEYLTKEFSSVYEDAQCERLSNMSKNELIEEYLLLEAKYDTLVKRAERYKPKDYEEGKNVAVADKDLKSDSVNSINERDHSNTDNINVAEKQALSDILQQLKDQEEQIRELQLANENLKVQNEHLQQHNQTMSEDSESDSSSSSDSCSTSSSNSSPLHEPDVVTNDDNLPIQVNGIEDSNIVENGHHHVNGFHSPTE
ncbi:protein HEXIM1 [Pieris brassicae]|uniref:Protein HEXIM1 n=1 Tax=Pieris brassicae TaxID=7116 RepID=A0A9P0XEF7_PIEBR|nr:protein HEXIM1 [Pieris brassicae]CAH4031824.1 unnamed protein product [Pieris brassicae]